MPVWLAILLGVRSGSWGASDIPPLPGLIFAPCLDQGSASLHPSLCSDAPTGAPRTERETAPTIQWQGCTWHVKQVERQGPGPCRWEASNAWVDDKGFLHLKISHVNGKWSCAEIWTDHDMDFGTYQCEIEGPIDKLDPNVVFSMFSYAGPDGVKEIDIEYAKWGNAKEKNAWWTVYPNDSLGEKKSTGFDLKLDGSYTTSRYEWSPFGVHYWMLGGHQAISSTTNLIKEWNYRPDERHSIPQTGMPLHFNLWLFQGKPPKDGKPVEIILHDFTKA